MRKNLVILCLAAIWSFIVSATESTPFITFDLDNYGTEELRYELVGPGLYYSADIPFKVAVRGIVLKSELRPDAPESSPFLPLEGRRVERLAFCHATEGDAPAGTPIYFCDVNYADGTKEAIAFNYGKDIQSWWGDAELAGGCVAWRGMKETNPVTLYHCQWKNPRPDIPVAGIQFRCGNVRAYPMLAAVTAVTEPTSELSAELDKSLENHVLRTIDISTWYECPLDWQGNITPDSALDFSFLNHKPAGKHGFVRVTQQGHFEIEQNPGEEVRFWGTNIAFAGCFPPKELAPGIARSLAMQGCNMVRMHLWGIQQQYPEDQIINRDGSVNEDARDRMEFFISELKSNGVYIYMDWNDGIMYDRLNPEIPPVDSYYSQENLMIAWKFLSYIDPRYIQAVKRLAELIFTHENPYTGLRMVDDPAIAVFEITNENTILSVPNFQHPEFSNYVPGDLPSVQNLKKRWQDWQVSHEVKNPHELSGKVTRWMPEDEKRFYASLEEEYFEMMRDTLHQLGARVPICGTNWVLAPVNSWTSRNMDFVSSHPYGFAARNGQLPGNLGFCVTNTRPLAMSFFPWMLWGHLRNKPMIISEWQFEYPLPTRCEAMPWMLASASLNSLDGLVAYCATGSNNWGRWQTFVDDPNITTHTQHLDPATWGQSPLAALAYRTRALQPALHEVTLTLQPDDVFGSEFLLERYPYLSTMTNVTIDFVKKGGALWPLKAPGVSAENLLHDLNQQWGLHATPECLPSDTGEIRRCFNPGLMLIDTPTCQCAVGALNSLQISGNRSLKDVEISAASDNFASFMMVSLDGKPINQSGRVLASLVGNAWNKTAKFHGDRYLEWGKSPVITEGITLTLTIPQVTAVYAIHPQTGARLCELPIQTENGKTTFALNTAEISTMYIELIR